jgi:NAD(P)-dependent dehydrogenase (short-subunit alcohol dehydrogenase family)
MELNGAVALVTGANRGIGLELARALRDRGARVYAGTRDVAAITEPGLVPIELDVTSPDSVAAAAAQLTDVTLVINNAGISTGTSPLDDDGLAAAQRELDVNYFGPMRVSRAFAPVLAANGGGALVNVLSVLSWISLARIGNYSASKSAAWSLTNSLRQLLQPQGTVVTAAHFAFVDTDMTQGLDVEKLDAAHVANMILDGVERGDEEVIVDDFTRAVKAGLSGDLAGSTTDR